MRWSFEKHDFTKIDIAVEAIHAPESGHRDIDMVEI